MDDKEIALQMTLKLMEIDHNNSALRGRELEIRPDKIVECYRLILNKLKESGP